ncbi:MAG: nitroreductase family protein [Oscillospiraceae bacterium]|nr:nitroreductase family protein [Oscillospiraceae bacterium]
MNFQELAKSRYSVRSFQDNPIEKEKLNLILEAGRLAPTACNNQPQKIYVANSAESRQKLASVCRCTFGAPTILVVCYDRTRDWKNKLMPGYESGETDAAIVCTHMMLQAFDLGIGSCWVGYFNAQTVAEVLGLPENITVSALLPMGYPAENAEPLPLHSSFRDFADTIAFI